MLLCTQSSILIFASFSTIVSRKPAFSGPGHAAKFPFHNQMPDGIDCADVNLSTPMILSLTSTAQINSFLSMPAIISSGTGYSPKSVKACGKEYRYCRSMLLLSKNNSLGREGCGFKFNCRYKHAFSRQVA